MLPSIFTNHWNKEMADNTQQLVCVKEYWTNKHLLLAKWQLYETDFGQQASSSLYFYLLTNQENENLKRSETLKEKTQQD